MADDIVRRLRQAEWLCRECGRNGDRTYTEEPPWWTMCCDLCDDRNDAADEIERLRARLQIVEDHIRDLRCENAQLRGDLYAAYCRMDDMEGYNDD